MIEVVRVLLKNEMDLVVSYRTSIELLEFLEQPLQVQTTFAVAVMEVCREVINKADNGILLLGLTKDREYSMTAVINFQCDTNVKCLEENFLYARRLILPFTISQNGSTWNVKFSIELPVSVTVNEAAVRQLTSLFKNNQPCSSIESIKKVDPSGHQNPSRVVNEDTGDFLSVATHELKTPLSIIKAYAELAMGEDSNEELQVYLDKIDRQCDKLNAIIHQLGSAADEGYEMKIVEVGSFVKEILPAVKNIVPEHEVSVVININAKVRIDKTKMEQVFAAMLAAIVKYTTGTISIMVDSGSEENDVVIISIYDPESSLAKGNLKTAFEKKFYANKESHPLYTRSGLGLYLASKIVNDHGGIIWVENTEEGTALHISIPLEHISELNPVSSFSSSMGNSEPH